MRTDRPSFNYTYTEHILAYTHTHTHAQHIAHALFQAIHTFYKTHTHSYTHTHKHTNSYSHTLCQSFTINILDRHTSMVLYMRIKHSPNRSSNKGLHNMGCIYLYSHTSYIGFYTDRRATNAISYSYIRPIYRATNKPTIINV